MPEVVHVGYEKKLFSARRLNTGTDCPGSREVVESLPGCDCDLWRRVTDRNCWWGWIGVGLDDLRGLSNLHDSMILRF